MLLGEAFGGFAEMFLHTLDPVLCEDVRDGWVLLRFLDVRERVERKKLVGFAQLRSFCFEVTLEMVDGRLVD